MDTVQILKKSNILSESDRYKVWLDQASFDLQAAELSKNNGFFEWACFQSQQTVEKALKAVIVKAGWRPPKMHKLTVLMGYCNSANEKFRNTKFEYRDLNAFTFVSRYPFIIPGVNNSPHQFITLENAITCIKQATKMLSQIKQLLSE